jgi:membrane protease YdiL (CAAX protease family)
MAFDGFFSAVTAVANALFLVAGVYVYVSLVRQIHARRPDPDMAPVRGFALPDAILGILLTAWFLLNVSFSSSQNLSRLQNREIVLNGLFSVALVLFVAGFLRIRGRNVTSLAGFSQIGFGRAAITGTILMLAAYPLVFLADVVTQRLLGGGSEKQGIVELFNASSSMEQRILIIVLAVAVAPVGEEFLFRFFLYGVLKRYFGRGIGLIVNALLFAAVHAHLPSFGPLFILGVCFTIAYEWSGSLLVSMTMHALFNALTLTALAFPDLVPQ